MRTEADRKAFYKDQAAKAHKAQVAKWLSENLEIGVLNGGKYYRIENGQTIMVTEFS